ncbi:MAG: iron-containing redox enzyme family protein, partial [Firmicutes bacterium]|nr:iron-containing redox enzyme family protein [Bacillota bacterium]
SAYVHRFGGEGEPVTPRTETLACANLQTGMAHDRSQSWRLAGYLAAFEENAPDRCQRLLDACVRHGMDPAELSYLSEHIHADVGHAQGLFERIVAPVASSHPLAAREIAQGFGLRLVSSADYCDALLDSFVQRAARV